MTLVYVAGESLYLIIKEVRIYLLTLTSIHYFIFLLLAGHLLHPQPHPSIHLLVFNNQLCPLQWSGVRRHLYVALAESCLSLVAASGITVSTSVCTSGRFMCARWPASTWVQVSVQVNNRTLLCQPLYLYSLSTFTAVGF